MRDAANLKETLARIDGRGYRAYREIGGSYSFPRFALHIDRVQPDPFAPPSRLRVRVRRSIAKLPDALLLDRRHRIALEDFLARAVHAALQDVGSEGRSRSGVRPPFSIGVGRQEVIERSAVRISDDAVEARLELPLPGRGRRVHARQTSRLLLDLLPAVVERALVWGPMHGNAEPFVQCIVNQETLRAQLRDRGLVAFAADGAILPRRSGAVDRPMSAAEAVPLRSPPSLRVHLPLAYPVEIGGRLVDSLSGLGIPPGVTLIVGGGYHGKSTLLDALIHGVYPHVPGDGREYVVTDPDAVAIRAEDGRRVERVDIGAFIGELPGGRSTAAFRSEDASGSTSQAASIAEAIEAGARTLLIDEDTSAANFMVRDARMQRLVAPRFEPITPFVDRVRQLYEVKGISTILVMGGCGDYLDVADTVIMMRSFLPLDATTEAAHVAASVPSVRTKEPHTPWRSPAPRAPDPASVAAGRARRGVRILARGRGRLEFGQTTVDLSCVAQIVDRAQARAIGCALHLVGTRLADGATPISVLLDRIDQFIDRHGLDALAFDRSGEQHPGALARPRRHEIAAALNRLRTLVTAASPRKAAPEKGGEVPEDLSAGGLV